MLGTFFSSSLLPVDKLRGAEYYRRSVLRANGRFSPMHVYSIALPYAIPLGGLS